MQKKQATKLEQLKHLKASRERAKTIRVGHKTQKGQVAAYFVKPGRSNNTNKVSLTSGITQTHPEITSRSLTTLTEFQFNFKSSITAVLTDD